MQCTSTKAALAVVVVAIAISVHYTSLILSCHRRILDGAASILINSSHNAILGAGLHSMLVTLLSSLGQTYTNFRSDRGYVFVD